MILLRLISWPYFRKHVLRTALTTAGIVLGVAVFVGMHTANSSVLLAFSRTVDRIAGKTELQVTAGEAGFPEDVLEKVQSASTVRVAVPVIEAVVDSNLKGQGNVLVLGVDMTGDRTLRDYDLDSGDDAVIDDPLVFLAQPDSIILSKEFADKNHIAVGGRLPLGTVEGEKQFTVRGVMKSSGLTSAFGGNLAIMDIYAAQHMFGRGRSFDRIDLAVKEGTTLKDAQQELTAMLGPGFQVDPPSGRGQQFEAMLAAYSMMVGISSLFALFIGMFIIYNSFAIAVTQRRSEIGILRALGYQPRRVVHAPYADSILRVGLRVLTGLHLAFVRVYLRVGRSGPDCSFAPCPTPSATLSPDAYPLYSAATWQPAASTTLLVGTTTLSGALATSTASATTSDIAGIATPFVTYYDTKLTAAGWAEDKQLDADGAGSSVRVYKKGTATIVISYSSDFTNLSEDTPAQCPCTVSFSIFTSNTAE